MSHPRRTWDYSDAFTSLNRRFAVVAHRHAPRLLLPASTVFRRLRESTCAAVARASESCTVANYADGLIDFVVSAARRPDRPLERRLSPTRQRKAGFWPALSVGAASRYGVRSSPWFYRRRFLNVDFVRIAADPLSGLPFGSVNSMLVSMLTGPIGLPHPVPIVFATKRGLGSTFSSPTSSTHSICCESNTPLSRPVLHPPHRYHGRIVSIKNGLCIRRWRSSWDSTRADTTASSFLPSPASGGVQPVLIRKCAKLNRSNNGRYGWGDWTAGTGNGRTVGQNNGQSSCPLLVTRIREIPQSV
jgi:hypothetical protein